MSPVARIVETIRLLGVAAAITGVRLSPSGKRVARTAYQVLVAVVTIAPLLVTVLASTPAAGVAVLVGGWIAVVALVLNRAEDAGLIPAWLKAEGAAD